MNRIKITIILLLLFNALTALAGGILLMTGGLAPPQSLIEHTIFTNYFIPGLILFAIVGGSSLVGLISVIITGYSQNALVVGAGLIMLGWIASELIITTTFHWLQVVYLMTGLLVVYEAMLKNTLKKVVA